MQDIIQPIEIVHSAQSKGINLFVNEGKLGIKKEKDVDLPPDLIKLIKEHRSELIDFLEKEVSSVPKANLISIEKIPEADSYQASNAQRRLWMASRLEEGSIAYNIPNAIGLDGAHSVDCFQRAIYAVVERHEILRTVFRMNDMGELRQYILTPEELGFSIDYKDYRSEGDVACQDYISADIYRPFDLAKGPLFRASLFQVAEGKYTFYYNMHHIISDGWSMEVLAKDIGQYYHTYFENAALGITPLRIQYKDYAAWQLSQLDDPSSKQHKDYWLSQLSGEIPEINLPAQKRRPPIKTYNGRSIGARLSPATTSKLRNFVTKEGGSLFMGLLAVWKVLLYRYTGETDLIIGNPVSGRDHPDLEDQIGFYINTLAIRNKINPNDNFLTFFKQIKDTTLSAYEHQMYPFDNLTESLDLQNNPSRSHLFDILVDYHGTSETGLKFEDGNELQDLGKSLIKFDLEFDPTEAGGGVDLLIAYNTDVYDQEMIEGFAIHYKRLMEAVLDRPEDSVGKINFLSNEEAHQLLHDFNVGQVEYFKESTIVDMFLEQAQKTPGATAVVFKDESLTYQELDEISNQLAHYLTEQGVGKETLVPICVERSLDMIVGMLGIIKAGGAYVPIDPNSPPERLDFILEDIRSHQLLTHSTLKHLFEEHEDSLGIVCIDKLSDLLSNYSKSPLNLVIAPEQLIYVIYTSGTTGVPKGVMVEHRNLSDYTYGLIQELEIDSAYSYGLMSTPSADLGNTVLFGSLATGGTLHTFSKEMLMNAHDLWSYFNQEKIDIIKIVPSHWLSLCNEEDVLLPEQAIIFGGEILRVEAIEMIKRHAPSLKVVNHYGPTETTIGKLMHKVDLNHDYNQVPIGKPFSNSGIYILSKEKSLLPVRAVGELHIDGAGLARGYLNRAELTAEKFITHPFKTGEKVYNTGDLARWLPDGNIDFIGRKDNQVKIRGYRIELEEIEAVLNELYNIEQSVVMVKEDKSGSKQLVAYIVSRELVDANSIAEGLMLVLEEKLPEYMVPNIYVKLDKMPLTPNGKIDRKALSTPDEDTYTGEEYVPPSNEIEKVLVAVWESVLKRDNISIKDNFYGLGGDSIKSIQLISQLKKRGYNLPVRESIKNPILENMARVIEKDVIAIGDSGLALGVEQIESRSNEKSGGVSENQKYFFRRPEALIPSPVITVSNFTEATFEKSFRKFLSFYPSLLVAFEKDEKNGNILQRNLSSDAVKLEIKTIRSFGDERFTEMHAEADAFLRQPFNYFNGTPLIRVFLAIDSQESDKVLLRFCIAHALVDVDTFGKVCENLEHAFDEPKVQEPNFSNLDFAFWQNKFLNSEEGRVQRNWWLSYLENLPLVSNEKREDMESVEYINQRIVISGTQYKRIKEAARALNLPVTALFLTAHQQFMGEIGFEESSLQMIAINGREETNETIDIRSVLGITTNFLPLRTILFNGQSLQEYVYNVYERYIKIRLYQKIPYEVIREDTLKSQNVDIDRVIKGYFNFASNENNVIALNESGKNVSLSTTKVQWNTVYNGIALVCGLHKNAVELRMLCPKELYENVQYDIDLKAFIDKNLTGLVNNILV